MIANSKSDYETIAQNVLDGRAKSYDKAIDSLARYKFEMFGYWSSSWVKFNQLLPVRHRQANPFRDLVKLAREMREAGKSPNPNGERE